MTFERPDIIRPPSEAGSYFLPVTSGCSNNSCGFCNYYGCKLNLRELDEIKKEIDALAFYVTTDCGFPEYRLWFMRSQISGTARGSFQDGDALVYPYLP